MAEPVPCSGGIAVPRRDHGSSDEAGGRGKRLLGVIGLGWGRASVPRQQAARLAQLTAALPSQAQRQLHVFQEREEAEVSLAVDDDAVPSGGAVGGWSARCDGSVPRGPDAASGPAAGYRSGRRTPIG